MREFEFAGFFRDPLNEGSKNSVKISGHFFVRKFVPHNKIFRANFVLQMCHPNKNVTFSVSAKVTLKVTFGVPFSVTQGGEIIFPGFGGF